MFTMDSVLIFLFLFFSLFRDENWTLLVAMNVACETIALSCGSTAPYVSDSQLTVEETTGRATAETREKLPSANLTHSTCCGAFSLIQGEKKKT